MLWGCGTAVGELPPYLVTKAARKAGSTDETFAQEMAEAREAKDVLSKMKMWTIDFTERHGFLGVFLLASWPNAAFDMCGMCCGYLMMPFWTFFFATMLGKGMVKVNGQAVFFVNLFGNNFFKLMCHAMDTINQALLNGLGKDFELRRLAEKARKTLLRKFNDQSRLSVDKLVGKQGKLGMSDIVALFDSHDEKEAIAARVLEEWDANKDGILDLSEVAQAASATDGKVSLASLDPGTGTSIMNKCWELFIIGLVIWFCVSIIDEVARSKQAELDAKKVEAKEKEQSKKK